VATIAKALTEARNAAGLNQSDAAGQAAINRVVLSYYENGQRQPSLAHLRRLADVYGVDAAGLLEGRVEPSARNQERLLFRTSAWVQANQAKARVRQVLRIVELYSSLLADLDAASVAWTESRFDHVRGRQTRRYAVAKAHEVRRTFGLGEAMLADVDALADEVALVFRAPLGSLDFAPSGLSWLHPSAGFCVLLNSSVRPTHQRFTLAHELAHVFFHLEEPELAIVSLPRQADEQERFANAFAGELLVPGPALTEVVEELQAWESLDDAGTVVRLAERFEVSYAAMLVRLRQEKLITPAQHIQLQQVSPTAVRDALGLAPESIGAPDDAPLEIPAAVRQLARRAYLEGVAGEGALAEGLGLDRQAVQRLVQPSAASADELAESRWFSEIGEFREGASR
jgi:Zn-dependent peptidase ImmA (M78 family)/transcriptional regulator with XRE-family HTH domain